MRSGFSMVTAVFLIVIMATVAMLVFNLSGKMTQTTTIQYRNEQAALLAQSYTEYALLQVLKHDRSSTNNCIQTITGVVNNLVPSSATPSGVSSINGGGYKVDVAINYLGNALPCSSNHILNSNVITTDYNTTGASDAVAAILVDVFVRYKDPSMVEAWSMNNGGTMPTAAQIPWITYHTRRLLKI